MFKIFLKKTLPIIFPEKSYRRKLVKKIFLKKYKLINDNNNEYKKWIIENEKKIWIKNKKFKINPLISIIVPAYNTPSRYIRPLVESLINQEYKNWEACIVDASNINSRSLNIKKLCSLDDRMRYKKTKNRGISDNTNIGINMAKGKYVGFLDHDDELSKFALTEVVSVINDHKNAKLIYSDEDKISDDGRIRTSPFFKPDWSPDLMLGVNYITHFVVVEKKLTNEIGGLRKEFDGSQDYDFLLRITEKTNEIYHIPKILYHWRLADGSTSKSVSEKNYADSSGRNALRDAIKRRGLNASIEKIPDRPTNYKIKYKLPSEAPLVSIIIPFKDKSELLRNCINSILNETTYPNYEIILISNNSSEKETFEYIKTIRKNKKCKTYIWDNKFNYSKINNYGRTKASGEYLILLNNDTKVISKNWIEELVGVASQDNVGAVGPMLYYPNKTIQHAGVIVGMKTMAGHVFRGRLPNEWTHFGMASWPRDYIAVTGACLVVKSKLYDELGGLDEKFTIAGSDVAFCISLYEKGYKNIYWPFVQLIHYESVSVGTYDNGIKMDYDLSLDYYKPYLKWKDPYFNVNLDILNEHIGIRHNYD